jgi:hypothetical protein
MIALLFLLGLCLAPLPEQAQLAWKERYVLLMGIDPIIKALPAELADAACPPLRLEDYSLPVGRYTSADLERNRRLYGENDVMLEPKYVVLHFTVVDSAADVIDLFRRPSNLAVGNQEPVTSLVSVHYMVDKDGVVLSLVPEERRTSGTYGLDHRALAIEMVAADEKDLLSRPVQLLSTFCLVDGLLKKYDLPVWAVISHQEVALGELFLSDYTDIADTESPYWYPKRSFRYDPGRTVMAWAREFLLRRRGVWGQHPASSAKRGPTPSP